MMDVNLEPSLEILIPDRRSVMTDKLFATA